jgi:hypothetical protein
MMSNDYTDLPVEHDTWTFSYDYTLTKTDYNNGYADSSYAFSGPGETYSDSYREYLTEWDVDHGFVDYSFYDLNVGETAIFHLDMQFDSYGNDYYAYTVNYVGPDETWSYSGSDTFTESDIADLFNTFVYFDNYDYSYDYDTYNCDYDYDYYTSDISIGLDFYDANNAVMFGEGDFNLLLVNDGDLTLSLQDWSVVTSDGVSLVDYESIVLDSYNNIGETLTLTEGVAENLSFLTWDNLHSLDSLDSELALGLSQLSSQYGDASEIASNDSVLFISGSANDSVNFADGNWHLLGSVETQGDGGFNAYIHDSAANTQAVVLIGSEIQKVTGIAV